jgi:hypothetical protein
MFDNGSLLRRRKRFKTAAKQRAHELAQAKAAAEKTNGNEFEAAEAYENYSEYEDDINSESEPDSPDKSQIQQQQNHVGKSEKSSYLAQQNVNRQLSPQELNQMQRCVRAHFFGINYQIHYRRF